jgi:hypothetical protein
MPTTVAEVNPIPAALWRTMTLELQSMMRFPLAGN